MDTQAAVRGNVETEKGSSFDVIVIGAGVAGLYQLYKLRELGLQVRVLEAGSAVGGTWYWNRYPGARFDSESHTYGYSFSPQLLEEWHWSERFAPQPETERYLNYVADKFDLRRDIQFNSRVAAARYDDDLRSWELTLEDGRRYSTRFLVSAIGILSSPTMPNIPGIDAFKGVSCHTHTWPRDGVDFAGKRVGIIGTGATAVQTIQEIAKTVGHLTVFQRTPNWCAPLHNGKISEAEMRDIRAQYQEIFALCRTSPGCYIHAPDPRKTLDVPLEEREAFWEKLYVSPGDVFPQDRNRTRHTLACQQFQEAIRRKRRVFEPRTHFLNRTQRYRRGERENMGNEFVRVLGLDVEHGQGGGRKMFEIDCHDNVRPPHYGCCENMSVIRVG